MTTREVCLTTECTGGGPMGGDPDWLGQQGCPWWEHVATSKGV